MRAPKTRSTQESSVDPVNLEGIDAETKRVDLELKEYS